MAQVVAAPIPPQKMASLYVGDLAPDVTEETLYSLFINCGNISSIYVCRDRQSRRSLGYAYVNFTQHEGAEQAMQTLNFTQIHDRTCRIMWKHRDPTERKSGKGNLIVKNLPRDVDNKTLQEMFSIIGSIMSSKVATDPKTGESLGYGYVHFADYEHAVLAIEKINGMDMNGTKLCVEHYVPKQKNTETNWTNLFINGLPPHWTKQMLAEECSKFGKVVSTEIFQHKTGKHAKGFCNFLSHEDAIKAHEALKEENFGMGRNLYTDRYRSREEWERERQKKILERRQQMRENSKGKNLYVKNFPDEWTDEHIREAFAPFGTITSGVVMTDQVTKATRGFGFVCYATKEEADKAIESMNGKMIGTKPLYVAISQSKEDRRNQFIDHMNSAPQQYYPNTYFSTMYQPRVMMPQMQGMPMGPVGGYQHRNRGFRPTRQPTNVRGPRPARQLSRPMQLVATPGVPHMSQMMMHQMGFQQPLQPSMQQPLQQQMQHMPPMQPGMHAMPPQQQQQQQQPQQPQQQPQQQQPGMMMAPSMGAVGQPMMVGQQMQALDHSRRLSFVDEMNKFIMASPPITEEMLVPMNPEQRRNTLGERLYNLIIKVDDRVAKITGMMLELDMKQLLQLVNNAEDLFNKIVEAQAVLDRSDMEAR